MTLKQKQARERFKKVQAEAKKLRSKNPKLSQAQAVKQAWAIAKKTKVGAVKILQKGESKNAKVTKTLMQTRNKKGQFKGYKKVSGTGIGEVFASDFTRITNDTYGNPRYVIHFRRIADNYEKALKIARKVGGKKFHNKQYGGGIVFQSYEVSETAKYLNDAIAKGVGSVKRKKVGASKTDKSHKDTKSHNVNIRVVSGVPNYSDPDMAREIELFADNDSKLYFSRKLPILKNLQRKFQKGNYDIEKASKLWMYYINDALQRYNKEFGSRGDKWFSLMSVPDRKLLAKEYAKETLNEFELGNFVS